MKLQKPTENFVRPNPENACYILEFEVIEPTNDIERRGEKLSLTEHGEYCPEKGLRGYNLLFLLDHPSHYWVSKIVMRETVYEIPVDREKNWRPRTSPQLKKYILE